MKPDIITIENLRLDLRGLPRRTAEGVPALLGDALKEALAAPAADREQPFQAPAALHLNLRVGTNEPAAAVAGRIAEALRRSLRAPTLENSIDHLTD